MLILFSLQLISVYLVQSLEQYYLSNYKESLENQARLLSAFMGPGFGEGQNWAEDTVQLAREFRDLHEMEIIILDSYAHIIGTSGNQNLISRRLIRDEITRALSGNLSDNIRFDPVNQERRYYLAFPIQNDQSTIGVIYLSGSLRSVDDTLNEVKTILLTGVGLALAVSILLGIILTKTITLPIKEVTDQAYFMARGDFSRKINVQTADEIGRLGETFNYLAEQLSHTINEISSEKSKGEAIINNMSDGIVALDGKGRLIQVNPAARLLINNLGLKIPILNRSGFNLLRNLIGSDLMRQFIRLQKPLTAETSSSAPECTMQIKIAPFKVDKGKLDGTLIVLHDITRERELTRRQEEFVADVSHELRTPLATVKSYVETLLDGAAEEPAVRNRFLNVLARETDRMVNMVKDLLVLSQMDSSKVYWQKTEVDLKDLTMEAVEQLKQKLSIKLPRIEVLISPDYSSVCVDRDKVMRVFSNLLSNAVKYTAPDGTITINTTDEDSSIKVSIEDTGSGIPEEELPRVFERFYRVEKTRSRDFGGTGLGLSIARKVVEGHGGIIWLESNPGLGTKVCFTLPKSADQGVALP
ncbi:MAG: cell wall metabolism sensor histidine kinase WalK [Clostridia bacterium]|nr:cell wall metabolism sensor histidine kinase WalK [Clostridia bacterium]